jgi:integrase/recombinase XerC
MTTDRMMPSTIAMVERSTNAMVPNPPADHILGPVQDDWEAADVWLRAVRAKSRNANAAANTEATYRHHLAKLRWYVEQVSGVTPSRWSMQEVDHFTAFLAQVPQDAIGGRGHGPDDAGWRPFRCQPSPGSQADLRRFVHALFTAWHKTGYLRHNPMALHGAGVVRCVNVSRALRPELVEMVLDQLTQEPTENFTQRQSAIRDTFILLALRGLGLRASELIQARMRAFYPLSVPTTGKTYWVFHVTADTSKGGKARRIPVPQDVWSAFTRYRQAFGLPAIPAENESGRVILSTRTHGVALGVYLINETSTRRYFGAWREVTTRQGLYKIVTDRFEQTALRLQDAGRAADAQHLRDGSPHWLRHTFAKAALLTGQSMRDVAGALGHADLATTMIYTEQEARDLIDAWERVRPGSVATDGQVL